MHLIASEILSLPIRHRSGLASISSEKNYPPDVLNTASCCDYCCVEVHAFRS